MKLTHSFYSLALGLLLAATANAQTPGVGIGTSAPNAAAALDISATGKGLLIPRLDSASRTGTTTPPDGLMVFQTDGRKGFYYLLGQRRHHRPPGHWGEQQPAQLPRDGQRQPRLLHRRQERPRTGREHRAAARHQRRAPGREYRRQPRRPLPRGHQHLGLRRLPL